MSIIKSVSAKSVYTVISCPSVEVTILLDSGVSVPAMRVNSDLDNLNIDKAVCFVNENIAPALIGKNVLNQKEIDSILKEFSQTEKEITPFIPSISQAVCEAAAIDSDKPLYEYIKSMTGLKGRIPMPQSGAVVSGMNFGNKSSYSGTPYWGFISYGFDNTDDAVNAIWVTQKTWEKFIKEKFKLKVNVNNGNLFYPEDFFNKIEDVLDLMNTVIDSAGFSNKVGIWADFDADNHYQSCCGLYKGILNKDSTPENHISKIIELCKKYPIVLIENPLIDSDEEGYKKITQEVKTLMSWSKGKTVKENLFDGMTVSEAIDIAIECAEHGKNLIPVFSLSRGFKSMDYYIGMEISWAFRCGMVDYANRAVEVSKLNIRQNNLLGVF